MSPPVALSLHGAVLSDEEAVTAAAPGSLAEPGSARLVNPAPSTWLSLCPFSRIDRNHGLAQAMASDDSKRLMDAGKLLSTVRSAASGGPTDQREGDGGAPAPLSN